MDAPALPPDQARELAALRARAYGSEAGISAGDLARLEQLEEAAHTAAPPQPVVTAAVRIEPKPSAHRRPAHASAADPPAAGTSPPALDHPPEDSARGDDDADPRMPTIRSRRRLSAALAAAAVIVTIALVWGLAQLLGPRPDLELGPIPTDPETGRGGVHLGLLGSYGVDMQTIQQYEEYHAFTTWSAGSAAGQRCLVIYAGGSGPVGLSCVPPGLDPIVDVTIWAGMPEEMAGGLPPGSVVRYVLSGDRVLVWVRRAPL